MARLATTMFEVPIAYIALIDTDRQWFKAKCGLEESETAGDSSFYGHAILDDNLLVVPDTRKDKRFENDPMVIGKPFLSFYAGYPLKDPERNTVGTFCIADRVARELTDSDLNAFRDLALLAENEITTHTLQESLVLQQKLFIEQERMNSLLNMVIPMGGGGIVGRIRL